MSERAARPSDPSSQAIEQGGPAPAPLFIDGYSFLTQALQNTCPDGLDVHCSVKLDSPPLAVELIILHLHKDADLALFSRYFGFLVPSLRPYLLLAFKGPEDCLKLDDFDTARAYAMLCKLKYRVSHDKDIAVAMLYSRTEADFFTGCADNGFVFVETQPGVRVSDQQAISYSAVDLVTLGVHQPEHPINSLSARRRSYGTEELIPELGPFAVLFEEDFQNELKTMSQMNIPGARELLEDAERLGELRNSRASVERPQLVHSMERARQTKKTEGFHRRVSLWS